MGSKTKVTYRKCSIQKIACVAGVSLQINYFYMPLIGSSERAYTNLTLKDYCTRTFNSQIKKFVTDHSFLGYFYSRISFPSG